MEDVNYITIESSFLKFGCDNDTFFCPSCQFKQGTWCCRWFYSKLWRGLQSTKRNILCLEWYILDYYVIQSQENRCCLWEGSLTKRINDAVLNLIIFPCRYFTNSLLAARKGLAFQAPGSRVLVLSWKWKMNPSKVWSVQLLQWNIVPIPPLYDANENHST